MIRTAYFRLVLGIALGLLLTAAQSRAAYVVSVNTTLTGSQYTYDYSIQNTGDSPAYDFSYISPAPSASILSIVGPRGWVTTLSPQTNGTLELGWTSVDPATDIAPHTTLAGFRVVSTWRPGSVTWTGADEAGNVFSGSTTGPTLAPSTLSPVPEPTSTTLFGIGAISLMGLRFLRGRVRRRSSMM